MVYLLKMVIFHGKLLNNQMVILIDYPIGCFFSHGTCWAFGFPCRDKGATKWPPLGRRLGWSMDTTNTYIYIYGTGLQPHPPVMVMVMVYIYIYTYIYCESNIPKILIWGSPTTATCDTQFRCPPMKSALPPAWDGSHGRAPNRKSMGSQWKLYGSSSTMGHVECGTLTLIKNQQKSRKTKQTTQNLTHDWTCAAPYSVPSFIHLSWALLVARSFKMVFSSNREYFPTINACLRTWPSIDLVRQSANIALLFTHLNRQFSCNLSLMRRHSKVVLLSAHAGMDVFVDRS